MNPESTDEGSPYICKIPFAISHRPNHKRGIPSIPRIPAPEEQGSDAAGTPEGAHLGHHLGRQARATTVGTRTVRRKKPTAPHHGGQLLRGRLCEAWRRQRGPRGTWRKALFKQGGIVTGPRGRAGQTGERRTGSLPWKNQSLTGTHGPPADARQRGRRAQPPRSGSAGELPGCTCLWEVHLDLNLTLLPHECFSPPANGPTGRAGSLKRGQARPPQSWGGTRPGTLGVHTVPLRQTPLSAHTVLHTNGPAHSSTG